MKRAACDRSWQVEACRDGRLAASTGLAFSLHVAGCAVCQAEQRALDRLAQTLQETERGSDDVALRRLRQQTLEKANAALIKPNSPVSLSWVAGGAVFIALAAAAVFVVRPETAVPVASSPVLVVPTSDAKWQRNLASDVEHVDLTAGTLLFRVARTKTDRRLIVRVPDGEIEDLGTIFSVTVQDGKTSEIVVREGRVLFSRHGASALQLVAGSSWTPPSEAVKPAERADPPELGLAPEPAEPKSSTAALKPPVRRADKRARVVAPGPSEPAQVTLGAAEDAAYLHMLALLREGRAAEARLAAHAYLRAFPSGFRHVEVTRVADARDGTASADDAQE